VSVQTRLVSTLGLVAVLLILPAVYGLVRLREVRDIALELQGRDAAASLAVGRLEAALGQLDWSERAYIAVQAEEARRNMYAALDSANRALRVLSSSGFRDEARPAATLLARLGRSAARSEALVRAGRASAATEAFESLKPLFDRARASLPPVAEAIDRRGADAAETARRISAAAARGTLVALVASGVLVLLVGSWLTGSLTVPIRRLERATRRVARGEFEAPADLPYDRADEFGALSRSFRSMTGQLDELVRLRAEFVSMASHELKTPLNVMAGFSEMLAAGEYGGLSPAQRVAVERIREQATILDRLVRQLLDMSRLETGSFAVEMDRVPVRRLLRDLEESFHPVAAGRGIAFAATVERGTPAEVDGDVDRLRNEVFGNLLSNAFKFTPRGGSVELHAHGVPGAVVFEVSDTGPGIAPEHVAHVFDKYYQPSRESRALGAGLGLAIARDVVIAHGGTIEVDSTPGAGSCFRVALPAAGSVRDAPGAPDREPASGDGPAGGAGAGGAPPSLDRSRLGRPSNRSRT
jgi:signal transduction histidine kinase